MTCASTGALLHVAETRGEYSWRHGVHATVAAPHRRAAGRARQAHTSRIRAGAAADPEQETTMLSPRLHHFLDERHAAYTTLSHDRTITAQETANCAHIGNRHFAKTVMLKVDGDLAMMVMPAAYRIDLTRLSRALGGRAVELAQETAFSDASPDCTLRPMLPFGPPYQRRA